MSGIDRAFIKAFRKDPAGQGMAVPHVTHQDHQAEVAPTAGVGVPASPIAHSTPAPAPPRPQPVPAPSSMQQAIVEAPHTAMQGPHWSLTNAAASAAPVAPPANQATVPAWARPAYEVERLAWPEVCRQLVSVMGGQLDATAKLLLDQTRAGKKVVYVSGTDRRQGATTVLLCLAQRLATIGVKCALVDANFEGPGVVQSLGVSPVVGWEDVAREQLGVAEVMIQSEEDHLAVLPLRSPLPDARYLANDLHWPVTMSTLRQHYQIVLIDGPPWASLSSSAILSMGATAGIDSAILVSADANASIHMLTDATNQLTSSGIDVLGVIENVCHAAMSPLHGSAPTARIA